MLRRRRAARAAALLVVLASVVVLALPAVRRIVRDLTLPLAYTSLIRQQARVEHLDPALIAAVIFAETKFDARTSPTGALGLMQIEPATAEFLAHRSGGVAFEVSDLAEPAINIRYGAYYLRYLLDQYGGNETLALAAYNGGQTNVADWLAQAHAAGVRFTIAAIRFPQTRAYVARVEHAERSYAREYPRLVSGFTTSSSG
jgi:soluble lytic murein transglycosylase